MLREAGIADHSKTGPLYVDHPKYNTRSPRPEDLKERQAMLEQLRTGDVVAVASYGTLGLNAADFLKTVGQISECGASVRFCETDDVLDYPSQQAAEIAATLAGMAALVTDELVSARTRQARDAGKKSGATGGRPPISEEVVEAARRDWFDPDGPSSSAIAKKHNVSRSSLVNKFGPITECRQTNSK
jgi:DNA invertase Pin-like site-specific DNA recombinase